MELINWDKELERLRHQLDSQEQSAIMICDNCKKDIYQGEDYFEIEAGNICEDCFEKYQDWEKNECKRTAGEDE